MNYIELINQFWQIRRGKRITSLQTDLYFYLVHECNARGWENPFEVSNRLICASIDITEPSLIDARNRLRQLGLIDFQGGKRNVQSPVYCLKSNLNNLSRNRATSLVESLVETELKAEPEYKLNETKLNKNPLPLKKVSPRSGNKTTPLVADTPPLTMPFEGEEFKTLWSELVRSKKWRGKPLSALSLSLKKLSKYSEEFACVLIADAIEGQWQGVVFDSTDEKYEKWKKLKHGKSDSLQEAEVPGSRIWKSEELQG